MIKTARFYLIAWLALAVFVVILIIYGPLEASIPIILFGVVFVGVGCTMWASILRVVKVPLPSWIAFGIYILAAFQAADISFPYKTAALIISIISGTYFVISTLVKQAIKKK